MGITRDTGKTRRPATPIFSALWRRVPAQPLAQRAPKQLWNLPPAGTGISPRLSAAEPRAGTAHCLLSTGHSNVRNVTHPGARTAGPAWPLQPAREAREGFWQGHRTQSPSAHSSRALPVPVCAHPRGRCKGSSSHCAVTQLAGLMCTRGFAARSGEKLDIPLNNSTLGTTPALQDGHWP